MELYGFRGCCCARVMAGFGESATADYSPNHPIGVDHAMQYIREQVRSSRAMGYSQIILITNNEQHKVNTALDRMMREEETPLAPLQIIYTPWMRSRKHNTLTRTWILQLQAEPTDSQLYLSGVSNG